MQMHLHPYSLLSSNNMQKQITKYLRVIEFKGELPMDGTSLQGEMDVTYKKLVSVFGKETYDGDGYKVQAEWVVMTPCGIATIYDYKQGKAYNGRADGIPKTKVTEWHIGGNTEAVVGYVIGAILNA